jgi:tetratricopeptide (TPR) repeat protein
MLKVVKRSIFIFLLLFACSQAQAQTLSLDSSLARANELLEQGNYKAALDVLKPHKFNIHADRLTNLIYYWQGDAEVARVFYLLAMVKHPKSVELKLDFGRMLYEIYDYDKAESVLLEVLKLHPENVEAHKYLGFIYHSEGNYKESVKHFDAVLQSYPTNQEALDMLANISKIRAYRLGLSNAISSDNQPLNTVTSTITLKRVYSNYWQPEMLIRNYIFESDSLNLSSQAFLLGNKFSISKAKLNVSLKGGYYLGHVKGSDQFMAEVLVSKVLPKHVSLTGQWKLEPTLYALGSLNELINTNIYKLQADLKNEGGLLGQMSLQQTAYFDENEEQRMHVWLLSPALKYKKLKLRMGLASSYANTTTSTFESSETVEQVLQWYTDGMPLDGVYNPYFTPQNQNIQSVIGLLELSVTKKVGIKLSSDYGFLASADIPYLFFEHNAGIIDFSRGFYREKTSTLDVKAELIWEISQRFTMDHSFRYVKNFFYKSGVYSFNLNWIL